MDEGFHPLDIISHGDKPLVLLERSCLRSSIVFVKRKQIKFETLSTPIEIVLYLITGARMFLKEKKRSNKNQLVLFLLRYVLRVGVITDDDERLLLVAVVAFEKATICCGGM